MIRIDALTFLLLVESLALLLIVCIVFGIRIRSLRRSASPAAVLASAADAAGEQNREQKPAAAEAGSAEADQLRQTLEMYGKMIREMLDCRQIFDSTPARLTAVETACRDLTEKQALPGNESEGDRKPSSLEQSVSAIKAEQETLAVKFRIWESQFNRLQDDQSEQLKPADEIVRTMMSGEKAELQERLNKAENALREKSGALGALQRKYDNLEREYETLYRQQHQPE